MKKASNTSFPIRDLGWLGSVPPSWEAKALKWESNVMRGASPRPIDDPKYFDEEGEYGWVRISDVSSSGMYLEKTEQRLSILGASLSVKLLPGTLFLSIAGSVGKPCITSIKACIHDGFVYFPRWKGDSRFLFYVFASEEPYKGLGKLGTQLNLNTDTVGSIVVGIPPLLIQRRIADFLDAETAQIDELVSEKERMIALLEEKRAAQISRAVTRGLDPHVPLTPSGLEWLGDIPTHWDVTRLKHFASIGNGSTPSVENPNFWASAEHGYPWLNSSVVNDGEVREPSRYVTEIALSECHLPKIEPPALVVGITGQGRTRGMCSVLNFEATINQHLAYIKPDEGRVGCAFLRLMLGTAYSFLRSVSDGAGSTKGAITCEQLGNVLLPVAPIAEQRAIVAYLAAERERTAEVEKTLRESITLLHERRRALITAAVTGQIEPKAMNA